MTRLLALLLLPVLAACDDMERQARHDPYERALLLPGGRVAQPPVPGTVPWDAAPRPGPPLVTAALLEHGQRGFAAFCAPCHGLAGTGDGMAAGRFVPYPPSFHDDALRAVEPAHVVRVITEGVGRMYTHAHQVEPAERWAIAWYVKALQRHWAEGGVAVVAEEAPEPGRMTALRRERLERERAARTRTPAVADLERLADTLAAEASPASP
ncbi:c-type cytochrome [Azospirillum halopraeferens]|uniref:c-type cytochrome n=1 Tax=Azospirillum halopraeferens TaxID=34010 RepID=UPI000686DBE3|nr:cytochrome c [Azospirillum halopraeferens]